MMTVPKAVVILVGMGLALVGVLLALAARGEPWAIGAIAAIWTLASVLVGAAIVAYVSNSKARIEADRFTENAKENLALMQSLQAIQNRQNQTIMQQLGQAARLPQLSAPEPPNGLPDFMIDDGIFEELD